MVFGFGRFSVMTPEDWDWLKALLFMQGILALCFLLLGIYS